MDLKVSNNIDNNIFSTHVTVDALGTEQLSEDEEKELISNFPVKLAYRNLKFTKNIKINGTVPEITEDDANDTSIASVTLPALSNKEIFINEDFDAYYKIDYTKISPSVVDGKVVTSREVAAQAYCLIFSQVICDAVRDIMDELRKKAPAFEGETIISI